MNNGLFGIPTEGVSRNGNKIICRFGGNLPVSAGITDVSGIMYLLGTQLGTAAWANPYTLGADWLTTTDGPGAPQAVLRAAVTDRAYSGATSTANVQDSYVRFDFGPYRKVLPEVYGIQNRNETTAHYMVSWVLEASNDGTNWTVLHSGAATPTGYATGTMIGFDIPNAGGFWRYLQWRQTGVNSNGAYFFCPGEFEVWGQLSLNGSE